MSYCSYALQSRHSEDSCGETLCEDSMLDNDQFTQDEAGSNGQGNVLK